MFYCGNIIVLILVVDAGLTSTTKLPQLKFQFFNLPVICGVFLLFSRILRSSHHFFIHMRMILDLIFTRRFTKEENVSRDFSLYSLGRERRDGELLPEDWRLTSFRRRARSVAFVTHPWEFAIWEPSGPHRIFSWCLRILALSWRKLVLIPCTILFLEWGSEFCLLTVAGADATELLLLPFIRPFRERWCLGLIRKTSLILLLVKVMIAEVLTYLI